MWASKALPHGAIRLFHQLDVPMSQDLNLWAWVKDDSKRLYSPAGLRRRSRRRWAQLLPLRSNRNLVGYYIDNELDWGDGFAGPGIYFDHLDAGNPNRLQVIDVIQSVWRSVAEFNKAWNTKLANYSELSQLATLPRNEGDASHESAYAILSRAWLSHLAEDYFRVTTSIIHRYDPNHLILGVRFKGYAPEEVVSASRDYTDAQSLNYYVGDGQLDPAMFNTMYRAARVSRSLSANIRFTRSTAAARIAMSSGSTHTFPISRLVRMDIV